MDDINIKVGEYVMFLCSEIDQIRHGQITAIHSQSKYFDYVLYQKPENVRGVEDVKLYGERELIQTSQRLRAPLSSIVQTCKILIFNKYLQNYAAKSHKVPKREGAFYYRQRVNPNGNLHPELPEYCLCRKNIRLPDALEFCKVCGEPYHKRCIVASSSCRKCNGILGIVVELDDQSSSQTAQRSSSGRFEPDIIKKPYQLPLNRTESSSSLGGPGPGLERSQSSPVHFKRQNSDMVQYEGVGTQEMQKISEQLEKYERICASKFGDSSREANQRTIVRLAFFKALMIGMEQARGKGEWKDIQKILETKESNVEYCRDLAADIERSVWVMVGHQDVRQPLKQFEKYKKKVLMLKTNLLDTRNYDLRVNLLNASIEPSQLPQLPAKELAPKALKEKRLFREKKYFEEQTLLRPEDELIIAKSHKGEDVIIGEQKRKDLDFHETLRKNQIEQQKLQQRAELFQIREEQDDYYSEAGSNHTQGFVEDEFAEVPLKSRENEWVIEMPQSEPQPEEELKEATKKSSINASTRNQKSTTRRNAKKNHKIFDEHQSRLLNEIKRLSGISLYQALKARCDACLLDRDHEAHSKYLELLFAKELKKQQA